MTITLADAQLNTQDDVDYAIIDDTRRNSWLMDQFQFDDTVTPGTNSGALTYAYTRLVTPRTAGFRAYNTEYTSQQAVRQRFTSDLHPLGGSYQLDRALRNLGPAATNEQAFQMDELLKAVRCTFADKVINGDTAVDTNGFDGLDKALTGSVTEFIPDSDAGGAFYVDWSAATLSDQNKALSAIDLLDEFLSVLNGTANAILGNTKSITRIKSIARRAAQYSVTTDDLGREIAKYGNIALVDIGNKPDDSAPIIPIETRDPDGAGSGGNITNLTDLYAVRFGLDALHGASVAGLPLIQNFDPDWSLPGAVKEGEVEMGPVTMALKSTRACAVMRNVKVQ